MKLLRALAIAVLLAVFVVAGCETARGASIAQAESKAVKMDASVERSEPSVIIEIAVLPFFSKRPAALPGIIRAETNELAIAERTGHGYLYLRSYGEQPPSFNGLGHDHFARADV